MHLIAPLASGIASAAEGTAELYTRGTSSRATWYPDFEATSANSSAADISLDSGGSAIVYVDSYVTVVVKDSSGNTVRTFVAGEQASAVEYRGQSFTGTNYETALTGAGSAYPVSLQTILNRWLDSAGADDWEVRNNGEDVRLQDLLGGLTGLVYNVRSPEFGATGDGTTDDTSAIQAAINAAGSPATVAHRGGIVFFPPGEYRITTAITVRVDVQLIGCGTTNSRIRIDHASNNGLAFQGTSEYQLVYGLNITSIQSNTGSHVTLADGANVRFVDCIVGDSLTAGTPVTIASSTSTIFVAEGCQFSVASSSTANMVSAAGTGRTSLYRCRFLTPSTYNPANGIVYGNSLTLRDCHFVLAGTSSGTVPCIAFNSTTVIGMVDGCEFQNGGGATVTGMALGSYVSGSDFTEVNNQFGSTVTAYSYTLATTSASWPSVRLLTRETRTLRIAQTTSTVTIPFAQYGRVFMLSTYAGNVTVSATVPPLGSLCTLTIYNADGSSRDFTGDDTAEFVNVSTLGTTVNTSMLGVAFYDIALPAYTIAAFQ